MRRRPSSGKPVGWALRERQEAARVEVAIRLDNIAELLGFHPTMTAQHLADRLGCTVQTIYRTVESRPDLRQVIAGNAPSALGFTCGMPSCNQCGRRRQARKREQVTA